MAGEPGRVSAPAAQTTLNKPAELGELRDWLSRRNQERKQLGLPGADIIPKHHSSAVHLRKPGGKPTPDEKNPPSVAVTEHSEPVLHLGRGPDGRIHVRYIVKEEGPDQMQVYTPSGYANQKPAEDAAKLERLTPRGKKLWLSGSSLRDPTSYEERRGGGR